MEALLPLIGSLAGPVLSSLFGQSGKGLTPAHWKPAHCLHCGSHLRGFALTRPSRTGKKVHWHSRCADCGEYHLTEFKDGHKLIDHAREHLHRNKRLQAHIKEHYGEGLLSNLFHFDDSAVKNIPFLNLLV